MLVKLGSAKNFSSYDSLEFHFSTPGLHLISGATGAGKSTVCDLIPWVLFGRTAKNGAVNDVIAWGAEEDTVGRATVFIKDREVEVVRRKGKNNDLYFTVASEVGIRRGKDIPDTQRLINQALGITADQYLVSAYYHEMSDASQFFQTTAKNRRQITEQLVDLTQVIKATEGLTATRKELREETAIKQSTCVMVSTRISMLTNNAERDMSRQRAWGRDQAEKLVELETKSDNFEENKHKIRLDLEEKADRFEIDREDRASEIKSSLIDENEQYETNQKALEKAIAGMQDMEHSEPCTECGNRKNSDSLYSQSQLVRDLQAKINHIKGNIEDLERLLVKNAEKTNPFHVQICQNELSTNIYAGQLEEARTANNPYTTQHVENQKDLLKTQGELTRLQAALFGLEADLSNIDTAIATTSVVRQALIETIMREVEQETNRLFEAHYDSIMRIEFIAEEFDKLDVSITKDGNLCSYTQLSKGQKQMLKLCFAVACIKTASNHSNVKFEQLFFDEALDGMSDEIKIASFSLLESLQSDYNSIYVVDHSSDFKNMFTSRFEVSFSNGKSSIESAFG